MKISMGQFVAAIGIVLLVIVLAGCAPTLAHDWYPDECCNDRDCRPIPDEDIQVLPGDEGYLHKPTGIHIPINGTKVSPDGQYHGCIINYSEMGHSGAYMQCFWAPFRAA